MSADPDIHDEVSKVRDKVADLELSTTRKMGEIETTVRVVKHDQANMKMMIEGVNTRIDRFENHFKADMKDMRESVSADLKAVVVQLEASTKALTKDITTVNTKQEKSLSFFAGVVAVFTVGGGLLMAIGKVLFGGGVQ